MGNRLRDNLNSRYFEAANALTSKRARRRIVAYVESYDDIYFWRTVLSEFEDDKRYFEVMLPSKMNLTRGKKSVLMNFIEEGSKKKQKAGDWSMEADEVLGRDMIACVDADYDYLLQGATFQSKRVLDCPYVFHTYVYAIENYQCYAPSLHNVCVAVTLNDHRLFDFRQYFVDFSEAIYPLFIWSVMVYRNGNYPKFTITDMNRIADPGGFNVQNPEPSIQNIRRKVGTKVSLVGNRDRLAVTHACDVTDETAFLVGDADFDGRNLVMVADADGLCAKQVTLFGTRYKDDAVIDADGELAPTVHQGCDGQVGQCKQSASLTDVCPIQMLLRHHHFCHSMFCVYFCYPATSIGCKTIRTIQ